jgi:hypothetical protein
MSWKIETHHRGQSTTFRLIGRMGAEDLQSVQKLIHDSKPTITLDLEELSLVDIETVRFLGRCEDAGIPLLHCSQYIRAWIAKEQDIKEEQ